MYVSNVQYFIFVLGEYLQAANQKIKWQCKS